MQDFEKDEFIKSVLQKDKTISQKAEDIFENIDYKRNQEVKTGSWKSKILTMAAGFVVVTISAGTAIYVNKDKLTDNGNTIINESSRTAIKGQTITTATGEEVTILSEEVEEDEITIVKEIEDEYVKVALTSDNKVLIKPKEAFKSTIDWKGTKETYYEIDGVLNTVKDIYISKGSAILLLIDDGTVECAQIFNEENIDKNELYFYNQGKIDGLYDIVGCEQKEEPIYNSDEKYYYVNAIRDDGVKKEIIIGTYNDMERVNYKTVEFSSQDGTKKYTIEAEDGLYVQAAGWAGASNNVYYIYDECLYHISLVDGTETRIATNVDDLWMDDGNQIIARAKQIAFTMHRSDQYIKICNWDVSKSPAIDVQENDDIILTLKEDKSVTIEFKTGRLSEVFPEEKYFYENYIYNFYADNACEKDEVMDRYYANADIIYLGKVGIDSKYGVAYAVKKEVVTVDLYEYMKKSITAFNMHSEYFCVDYENNIKSFEHDIGTATLDDGKTKKCEILKITLEDNSIEHSVIRLDGHNDKGGTVECSDGSQIVLSD